MRVGPISAAVFALCTVAAPVLAQQQTTGLRGMAAENDALVWQAVGRLDAEGAGFCTGTLIAPELVLTAAHCVYDRKSGDRIADSRVAFLAGWRNGEAAAHRRARQVVIHPDYVYAGHNRIDRAARDLAVIQLDRPILEEGVAPFSAGRAPEIGDSVELVSYAMNRDNALS